jgi:membrane protease YdiL (CAAX protease family)
MKLEYTVNRRPGKWWAFLQFPLTRLVLIFLVLLTTIGLGQALPPILGIPSRSPAGVLIAALAVVASAATYIAFVRMIEWRRVAEFATSGAVPEFFTGLLIGLSLFAAVMVALWLANVAEVTATGSWSALAYGLAFAAVAAFQEEILLRGALFRIVEESLGSWIALGLSAAVFGGLHAFNDGATAIGCIAVALEAGVLLAAAYIFTRRLWLPIGLHLGWNFAEGGLFGSVVSGGAAHGLLASRLHGPDWLSGGAFGPEASVIAVVLCLAAGLALVRLAVRRRQVVAPFWRRVSFHAEPSANAPRADVASL